MLTTIDQKQLAEMFITAYKSVKNKMEIINSLNVYPVPDGDTGTNMTLTLKEIVDDINKKEIYTMNELLDVISNSSLMGGRGNSGVILSQFICGFCNALTNNSNITKKNLYDAFKSGTKEAYKSVNKPQEGTILTIMKEATSEFNKKLHEEDILKIFKSIINKSQFTLKKTPEMLPKLKQAGVVDAGGAGFVYFLEGFYKALKENGDNIVTATDDFSSPKIAQIWDENRGLFGTGGLRLIIDYNLKAIKFAYKNILWMLKNSLKVFQMGINVISLKRSIRIFKRLSNELKWQNIKNSSRSILNMLSVWYEKPEERYCVEVMLSNVSKDKPDIENLLYPYASSLIIAKIGNICKIHLHTVNIKNIQKIFEKIGNVEKMKIDDLYEQQNSFTTKKFAKEFDDNKTEIVAVVSGDGFKRLYESFEGTNIIDGGLTMNPSVSEIYKKIEDTTSKNIILLPNNPNVFIAAKSAVNKTKKNVKVLNTPDLAKGLVAMLNFNRDANLIKNYEMMKNSLKTAKTFLVSRAIKSSGVFGKKISKGQYFAMSNKNLLSSGNNINNVVINALKNQLNKKQLITLYFGKNIKKKDAQSLQKDIYKRFKIETQLYEGGQEGYDYIVSLE